MQGGLPPKLVPTKCIGTLNGHNSAVLNVEFTKDGNYCLSTGQDRRVILWNPSKQLFIKEYRGYHNHEISDVCILGDNSRFVTVGGDKLAFLWDVATGQVIRKFIGHYGRINCCKINHNEEVLCTGSFDQTVKLWDLKAFSKEPIYTLDKFKNSVTSICTTETEIICGSLDGCIRNYDIRKGLCTEEHLRHPIVSLALSNDKDFLLASCLDDTIRLVSKNSGQLVSEYMGHRCREYNVMSCFDPSNTYIASGSEDNRICFWDLIEGTAKNQQKQGKACMDLHLHSGIVFCVKFHEEKGMMLSASGDKTIKAWVYEEMEFEM